tara:strand:- start:196 stop:1101 length:906 start_codon:yes stop_codon:yes gene_type:complete
MEDCDDTKQTTLNELLDSFGIEVPEVPEKYVPSRFDPDKHNPLWGEEVYHQYDFDHLVQLNPCPIPVNGKLATTVRFSVDDDGEAEWLRTEQYSKERAERYPSAGYPYRPQPRPKTKPVLSDREYGEMGEVNISCQVLQQFMDEGGQISEGDSRRNTKQKTIHLGCNVFDQPTSLCGAGVSRTLRAAYSGQPDEVGTYQVCSVCRRIAEARFKRKVTKRKPKPRSPKPLTPEEIERREQLRIEDERRKEEYRRVSEIENRRLANECLDIIEKHYPKVDEAIREAAITDLMQLWNTEIYGGE